MQVFSPIFLPMSKKHVFDSSEGLVLKSLQGAVRLNPALALHAPSKCVYIVNPSPSVNVAVISGGGAGHEPAHASYTGRGMLSASVSGDIFASPNAAQILNTIKFAALSGRQQGPRDVLVIINNYTGDRLNFGLAIEKARRMLNNVQIESVVVADDVSLLKSNLDDDLVGPRGLAGNILVCKLLGALAERGGSLAIIKKFGDAVVGNLASVGVGLAHCHIPGRSKGVGVELQDGDCEIGLGLHNEQGVSKIRLQDPDKLIERMLSLLLNSRTKPSPPFLNLSDTRQETVLFVNNLGGLSQLEMGAVLEVTCTQLSQIGINPYRIYMSSYMTSLNAPGFSLSILNVSAIHHMMKTKNSYDVDVFELLDDSTDSLSWVGVQKYWPEKGVRHHREEEADLFLKSLESQAGVRKWSAHTESETLGISLEQLMSSLHAACDAVLEAEEVLTQYDTVVGDGDCGATFSGGAKAVLAYLNAGFEEKRMGLLSLIREIADVLEDNMGGTIGALFSIFLNALSVALDGMPRSDWHSAPSAALVALSEHTPAKPGDRTIVDALHPFCSTLAAGASFSVSVKAALEGAQKTSSMKPRLGRAVYMLEDLDIANLPPDPGAWGFAVLVEGLEKGLHDSNS